jgi:hypothetical protein
MTIEQTVEIPVNGVSSRKRRRTNRMEWLETMRVIHRAHGTRVAGHCRLRDNP